MYKLEPVSKAYNWGSRSFIHKLLSLSSDSPLAELWFGAHPQGPAAVSGHPLDELIASEPITWLGEASSTNAGKLPYLLKILAASEPLSIQVHPSKAQAETGFARENQLGIPLDASNRNYKDDNHKPELLMALTPFYMLCGIRTYTEIVSTFHRLEIDGYFKAFQPFAWQPNARTFLELFREICISSHETIEGIFKKIETNNLEQDSPCAPLVAWCLRLRRFYPQDNMAIAPLLMNLLHLNPYTAVYLDAGIPHAYLEGAGVEIMASSDNVIRAGLTPKHIDLDELETVMNASPYKPPIQQMEINPNELINFYVPVQDFQLSYFELTDTLPLPDISSPRIVLVLSGELSIQSDTQELHISQGQAVILPAIEQGIKMSGTGTGVIAS